MSAYLCVWIPGLQLARRRRRAAHHPGAPVLCVGSVEAATMTAHATHVSDYDRLATVCRAFQLLALLRHCPRDLTYLATALGVSARTVRRDLYTLERAGIPLITSQIPNQALNRADRMTTVWRLMPGAPCPVCHSLQQLERPA